MRRDSNSPRKISISRSCSSRPGRFFFPFLRGILWLTHQSSLPHHPFLPDRFGMRQGHLKTKCTFALHESPTRFLIRQRESPLGKLLAPIVRNCLCVHGFHFRRDDTSGLFHATYAHKGV